MQKPFFRSKWRDRVELADGRRQTEILPLRLGENWKRLPKAEHGAQPLAVGHNPVWIVHVVRSVCSLNVCALAISEFC